MNKNTSIIDKLVSIAYFWLGEENYYMPYTIIKFMDELKLSKTELKRINDLKNDWNSLTPISKKDEIKKQNILHIPTNKSEEDKLLWITTNVLMNLFNSGNFEMGYIFLLDFMEDNQNIYSLIIPMIQKSEFKDELVSWAFEHFFFGKDILGKNEFDIFGYKIEKI